MKYQRYFIPLVPDSKGFEMGGKDPLGRCILEDRGKASKLSLWVQDLKVKNSYKIVLILSDTGKHKGITMGSLRVDTKGKGELKTEFDSTELAGGQGLQRLCAVAVFTGGINELICPLVGFKDAPVLWKNHFSFFEDNANEETEKVAEPIQDDRKSSPKDSETQKIVPVESVADDARDTEPVDSVSVDAQDIEPVDGVGDEAQVVKPEDGVDVPENKPEASEGNRDIKSEASEGNRDVKPEASEGNRDVKPEASEGNRDVKPEASEGNRVMKPEVSEGNQDIKPEVSEGNQDIRPEDSKGHRDIKPEVSEGNRDIKPEASEDNRDIKPEASEGNRDIKPEASEDNRDIKPEASEGNRDIKPEASEGNRDIKPEASEGNQDVKPEASEGHRDIKQEDIEDDPDIEPGVSEDDSVVDDQDITPIDNETLNTRNIETKDEESGLEQESVSERLETAKEEPPELNEAITNEEEMPIMLTLEEPLVKGEYYEPDTDFSFVYFKNEFPTEDEEANNILAELVEGNERSELAESNSVMTAPVEGNRDLVEPDEEIVDLAEAETERDTQSEADLAPPKEQVLQAHSKKVEIIDKSGEIEMLLEKAEENAEAEPEEQVLEIHSEKVEIVDKSDDIEVQLEKAEENVIVEPEEQVLEVHSKKVEIDEEPVDIEIQQEEADESANIEPEEQVLEVHSKKEEIVDESGDTETQLEKAEEIAGAESNKIDELTEIFKYNIEITPFDSKTEDTQWVRISLREPIFLSIDYRSVVNHPLIIAAYKKYNHLVLGQTTNDGRTDYVLGVPGIFESQYVNTLRQLGFTQFKTVIDSGVLRPGDYGYWLCPMLKHM